MKRTNSGPQESTIASVTNATIDALRKKADDEYEIRCAVEDEVAALKAEIDRMNGLVQNFGIGLLYSGQEIRAVFGHKATP